VLLVFAGCCLFLLYANEFLIVSIGGSG